MMLILRLFSYVECSRRFFRKHKKIRLSNDTQKPCDGRGARGVLLLEKNTNF